MVRFTTRLMGTWGGVLVLAAVVVVVSGTALVAFANSSTDTATSNPTDLVRGGSFETLAPWSFTVRGGASARLRQDGGTKEDGSYSAHVNVMRSDTAHPWNVQLSQGGIPVSQGQSLAVSFWAKSSVSRSFTVVLQQASSPYTEYFNRLVNTTSAWQNFSFTFTPATSDSGALLAFNFAGAGGETWLDNVSILGTTASQPTQTTATTAPSSTSTPAPISTSTSSGSVPTTTTAPTPVPPTSSNMPAPGGYSNLIFDDTFSGTTLDSTKWIPQMGDQYGIWNDKGKLPYPYSAVGNEGGYNAEYGNPDQVVVNNGLTLNAQRDNKFSGYSWKAGYVSTHGKFTFNRGYVQIRAKLPDSTTGGWAGFWFLEGGGEIDLNETGYTGCGSSAVNQCIATNLHTSGNSQRLYNTGVDLTAGYHTYGMDYRPGQSVTMYFDGKQIAQFTSNVPTGAYTIILTETMAQNASGWHTLTGSSTSSPMSPFNVAEVQLWQ